MRTRGVGAIGIGAIVVLLLAAICPTTLADSPSGSDAFALLPASVVTLYRGEKIELTLLDRRTHQPVDPAKIAWRIDGQPADKLPRSQGSFTAGAAAGVASAVYRTPLKVPEHNTLALTATVAANVANTAAPATIKGSITITGDANWFALDGDTGIGPQAVGIDLDPAKSTARLRTIPFGDVKQRYTIQVVGTRKGTFGDIGLVLSLGPNSAPGTYPWSSRSLGREMNNMQTTEVGVRIVLDREHRVYSSTDLGQRDFGSTEGSTTILPTRPVDPPGEVKGFFSGRLCWGDIHNHFFPHYLAVRGHFAVHGVPPSTAPAAP